jgi:serine/threonine-protein kinase
MSQSWIDAAIVEGYQLEQALQLEGMSEVYRGRNQAQQPVVIKVLRGKFASDSELRKRFEREVILLQSLQHPHVIPIQDAGFTNNYLYLVMPYIQGDDLGQVMNQHRFTLRQVNAFLQPISQALSAGHALKIIHRDLKPDNILVEMQNGQITNYYLSDFGLAKRPGIDETLTNAGMKVGTPEYIAPEMILNKTVDHRADIYSLAVMLYELLIGEVPFSGKLMQVIMAHAKTPPPPLAQRQPNLPSPISALVMRNLDKDPAQRHQSMGELAADFQKLLEVLPQDLQDTSFWIR